MISKLLKRISLSSFLRNAFTSITGSSISQIIPILSAPILSRIYAPEDYGKLGIFMGIAMILGTISTLNYSNALLIPKEESEFKALIKLCVKYTVLTTSIVAVILILLFKLVAKVLDSEAIMYYLLLLPFSMLMIGFQNTLAGIANRKKLFKALANNRVLSAVITVLTSISFGLIFNHWSGLLIGYFISQIINSFGFYFRIRNRIGNSFFKDISDNDLIAVRKRFISFPKFGMTTDLLNNFTYQIPVFLLNVFVGPYTVGAYNMCNRLLALPSSFISSAVGEVFKQRAAQDLHEKGSCRLIYKKTFKTLSLVSIIPFLIIILFGPKLFSFFLGHKWEIAGQYARILSPIYLLRFVNSPLSYIIYLYGKLKIDLLATIYLNVTSFFILLLALRYFSVYQALIFYSINFCFIYVFMIRYSFNLSNKKNAF